MNASTLMELALAQQDEHGIILLDADARVVDWLPGAVRTFGYSREEMLGSTLERLFTPEDLDRGELDWELRAARSYGKSEDDRWQVRKDGVRVWLSGAVTALRNSAGETVGFAKIVRDRTDLRGHMEALQSRLAQAVQRQDEKHVVLGTLAHELRNPLGPLLSAAQLIRLTAPDQPRIGDCVQIIERQIRFIEGLLQNLLEITRIGLGKARPNYSTFPLSTVLQAAIETSSALLHERRQQVEVLIPDSVMLEADSLRLQQVVVNLLANSSKFSPPDTRIWIKATVDTDELVLRVEDHGRGIPRELLPKIFEFFSQGDADGSVPGQGVGLGLALVKSIVEMHGGTVQARSDGDNQGTEVIVRIPLRPSPAHPSPQP